MFAIFVICVVAAIVVFGIAGSIYFDQKENGRKMQKYFRDNFDKL